MMAADKKSLKVRKVPEEDTVDLRKNFEALENYPGFIRVGDAGYLYPVLFQPELEKIYNMKVRPTDVYVATFPRSGTTWTQEMVWLLLNDLDYTKAASLNLVERFSTVGASIWTKSTERRSFIEKADVSVEDRKKYEKVVESIEEVASAADPRFIKTHVPFSLLPPDLVDTAKVVYVARDPRDVAVSFYHLSRLLQMPKYTGDFKTYWKMFMHDNIERTPYFTHVKEAWDLRNHPNMLFLFYEGLKKDLPRVLKRTAKFFNKEYTDEQISVLCDHLNIENFRKNDSVNLNFLNKVKRVVTGEQPFVRKGKVGGWRDYFDEDMTKESEVWLARKLKETGIKFPTLEK